MPRDFSADNSRCWSFELRNQFYDHPPVKWSAAVAYCAWNVVLSPGLKNRYNIKGYLQFHHSRRRSTLKSTYHQFAIWRRASHAPSVYVGVYRYQYGTPLSFHHSKTRSVINNHTKSASKDLLNDKMSTQMSVLIRNYFNKY